MADQRYYPYVPWDDDLIHGDRIDHDRIHADYLLREGIYGPYATILRWLTARDNKKLIADTRVLCVDQTYQP